MTSENPTPFQRGTRVYPAWGKRNSDAELECFVLGVVYTLAGGLRVVIENMLTGVVSVVDPRSLSLRP